MLEHPEDGIGEPKGAAKDTATDAAKNVAGPEDRTGRAVAEAERLAAASNAARQALETLVELFFEHGRSSLAPLPAHVTKLALGLLPRVGAAERSEIARRVAHCEALPAEIAIALVDDTIEVAGPLLRQSPVLAEATLLEAATGTDRDRARAVAARSGLRPEIMVALARRGDTAIAEEMLSGPLYTIESDVAELLAATPELSVAATERLVVWSELSLPSLGRLFWSAGPQTRRIIVERAARRAADPGAAGGREGPAQNREFGSALFAAAASGRRPAMVSQLSTALRVPRSLAQRILDDETLEPLVVACRAAGVGVSQLTSLLVLMPGAGSATDSQAHIRNLVAIAEHLPREVAESFIGMWRGREVPRQARHAPAVASGHQPTAQPPARPAGQSQTVVDAPKRQSTPR